MNFIKNLNLKDRERKLTYILIALFVVFIAFRLLNAFFSQTILAKQELEEMGREKESILFAVYEMREVSAKNESLEHELRNLKNKFILESEDATYVMAHGYGYGILIKSIIPKDISNNGYYYTSAYSIEVEGAYQDIVSFISRLEQNPASKIMEMSLSLNMVDMNVQGTIVWEMYSFYERRTNINLAPIYEYGRQDPFQIPREYIGFLEDLIRDKESEEVEEENQNSNENESVLVNTLETEILRENIVEAILETVEDTLKITENVLKNADNKDNLIEFFQESIYSFPIKQEKSLY